jgi:hypothetical protein
MDTFNPDRPYQRLPLLPPAVDIESKAVLKACIEAHTALTELRVAGELIPNQAVLNSLHVASSSWAPPRPAKGSC